MLRGWIILPVLPLALCLTEARMESPARLSAEATPAADATLRAVHFVDVHEGWACGDDGVILHTIDGGRTWERQSSGTRATLLGLYFRDAFTGFCVGRETLPHGRGTAGVLLYTDDGGTRWQTLSQGDLPGLRGIHFLDDRTGYLLAESSEAQPTGLFRTEDGGVTWKMVPGERRPGWTTAAWTPTGAGILAGPGGIALLARGQLTPLPAPTTDGRQVRAVHLHEQTTWAVGERGLLLTSSDGAGAQWRTVDLGLPFGVRECWDFQALTVRGDKMWLAGRPGTLVLHSWDGGKSWQTAATGQALPLYGLYFVSDQQGWAVGAAGVILATADGGKTWQVQRRGGRRAAALIVSAQAKQLPLGTLALLGGDEGYLISAIQVVRAQPAPGMMPQAEDLIVHEAGRRCGGLAAEVLGGFSVPQYFTGTTATAVARYWGHGDEAAGLARLEEQLVLALRMWRPDVVLSEPADPRLSGGALGALVTLAMKNACQKAGQADAWPDQIAKLKLTVWSPKKLYARVDEPTAADVVHDLEFTRPLLLASASDVAARARALLDEACDLGPAQEGFKLIWSQDEAARQHQSVFQGSTLERGGEARRLAPEFDQERFDLVNKLTQDRRDAALTLLPMLAEPQQAPAMLDRLLRHLGQLDDEHGGEMVWQLAQRCRQQGQWLLARELLLVLLDRFPSHRAAPAAARWLIVLNSSTLAQHREAQRHFTAQAVYDFKRPAGPVARVRDKAGSAPTLAAPPLTVVQRQRAELRQWHRGTLAAAEVLAAFGPADYGDPRLQFCIQASQRRLGQADKAHLWNTQFLTCQSTGPWRDAAAAEIWLLRAEGPCPRPLTQAAVAAKPPFLDGVLDDDCWQTAAPVTLRDVFPSAAVADSHPTQCRLAYDDKHLYVALACGHPGDGHRVPPVRPRKRDDELRPYDRVMLLLDPDRSGGIVAQLEVDQRGCVAEECGGDRGWNPKWYVAVHSTETAWQIEAALPWAELVEKPPTAGDVWAVNFVRILPGKGVQAFAGPADVTAVPEGSGLVRFVGSPAPPASPASPAPTAGKPSR